MGDKNDLKKFFRKSLAFVLEGVILETNQKKVRRQKNFKKVLHLFLVDVQ